jgi:hypothetical protein
LSTVRKLGVEILLVINGSATRLPDGIFSNQKSQLGQILHGLRKETVCILNAHLEYITAILWSLGNLVIFPGFGLCIVSRKSGNPALQAKLSDGESHLKSCL